MATREEGAGRAQPRLNRRPNIGRLELAHLPLPCQQPQRTEEPRADAAAHIGIAATRLESRPAGDRFGTGIRRLDRRTDGEESLRLHLIAAEIIGLDDEAVQPARQCEALLPARPIAGGIVYWREG